jgi:uncharacterized membrane protein
MTDLPPPADPARFGAAHPSEGKPAALIAWGLYILSIPSANILVLVGLLVAYAARDSSTGLARAHIDEQIRLFWSVVWWTVGLWVLMVVSFITVILIPVGLVCLLGLFILSLWFTIKSILGLVNLMSDRVP